MAQKNLPQWVLDDLKKSAIKPDQGKKLGLRALGAEESEELVGRSCDGMYEIPYFGLNGQRLGFSRYKLKTPLKMNRDSKMRYFQPPKSAPRLYFPPTLPQPWKDVAKDQRLEVWVTEGEKKAASLCSLGVPCAAVSGVWSWRSKKQHESLIPEFRALLPRDVVLCFDSDADNNPQIKGALTMLAVELERRGGRVKLCSLPQMGVGKTGLDDFIEAHGRSALRELALLPKEPLGVSAALTALNTELMVVEDQSAVYSLKHNRFFTNDQLTKVGYADKTVTVHNAAGGMERISVMENWLKWPGRRTCQKLVYRPGAPQQLDDGAHNLWEPSGVEPRRRPAPLFAQLLDFLAQNLTKEQRRWWVQWLAYPLQHPGAKLYSACIMYSHQGGTGKTLLGYTLRKIYGEHNCKEVSQEELHSQFNSWAERRQFIIGAEISGSDKRSDSDKLKHMITRTRITINEKYQPTYELDDTCNYYLTTNHADAVYIENGDRRYFVVDTSSGPLPERFYREYDAFFKSDAGLAAIYDHLMRVDLSGFAAEAPPPVTEAKKAMHEVSGSEVDAVVRDLVRDPSRLQVLSGQDAPAKDLWTLEGLQQMLDPTGRISRIQVGKSLRKAGAPQPFRVGEPGSRRVVVLYAVANFERWAAASHEERAGHYFADKIAAEKRSDKVAGKRQAKGG